MPDGGGFDQTNRFLSPECPNAGEQISSQYSGVEVRTCVKYCGRNSGVCSVKSEQE